MPSDTPVVPLEALPVDEGVVVRWPFLNVSQEKLAQMVADWPLIDRLLSEGFERHRKEW